jgi:hypothetical protein
MNANILTLKKWHISFFSERQAAREHFRLSFTQTYILAIVMIAFLGVYYVWMLNQNATKGYNIRNLQMQYSELSFQENILDIRIAEWRSIDTILSFPTVQSMQSIDKPQFIILKNSSYSLKD